MLSSCYALRNVLCFVVSMASSLLPHIVPLCPLIHCSQAGSAAAQQAANYASNSSGLAGLNVTQLLANVSGVNGTTSAAVSASLSDMDARVSKLQSVAIAAIVFAMASACLALFASCRVFVVNSIMPHSPSKVCADGGGSSQARRKSGNAVAFDMQLQTASSAQLGMEVAVPPVSKEKVAAMV